MASSPQLDTLGLGIGKHIRQGAQADARAVGDRAAPLGQESADLADSTGDSGAVGTEQQPQDSMREVVAQVDERGHYPVDIDEPVPGTVPHGPPPHTTPSLVTASFNTRLPRTGQLLNQAGQMATGDSRQEPMREDCPIHRDRHSRIMSSTSNDNCRRHPLSRTNS